MIANRRLPASGALLALSVLLAFGCGGGDGGDNPPATYSISGTVSGDSATDVTITLSGAATQTATTDESGNFAFTGLANGSYTVTPSKDGYSFDPVSVTVTLNGADVTGTDFTCSAIVEPTFAISGTVTGATGVTLALTGPQSGSTTTDDSYSFTGLAPGTYTVTPQKAGYRFTPESAEVTVGDTDVTVPPFAATLITYSVSGTVSGAVVAGVQVSLSAAGVPTRTATTAANGSYSFSDVPPGNYTLSASKSGFTFSPATRAVAVTNADVPGNNFVASAIVVPTYTISGTVTGATGVTLTLTGPQSGTTTSDGSYSFTGLAPGAYTVTPQKAGYRFTPESAQVTVSNANATVPPFAATLITYSVSGRVNDGGSPRYGQVWTAWAADALTDVEIKWDPPTSGCDYDAHLSVFSVANAGQTPGATAAKNSTAAEAGTPAVSITPTAANSLILVGAYTLDDSVTALGANASTTWLGNFASGPYGNKQYVGRLTNATSNTNPVTVGSDDSFVYSGAVAVEIVSAGGSAPAIDSGFPVQATQMVLNPFDPIDVTISTPGPNRMIVAIFTADGGGCQGSGTVSGGGLTWTKRAESFGAAVEGVEVALKDGSTTVATVTTDSAGSYEFPSVALGNYTITASKSGYSTSGDLTVSVSSGDVTQQDIIATLITYTVSGAVLEGGVALEDVEVNMSDGVTTFTAFTDELGVYQFRYVPPGTYTVTPAATGYTFSPTTKEVVVDNADVTVDDFAATPDTSVPPPGP